MVVGDDVVGLPKTAPVNPTEVTHARVGVDLVSLRLISPCEQISGPQQHFGQRFLALRVDHLRQRMGQGHSDLRRRLAERLEAVLVDEVVAEGSVGRVEPLPPDGFALLGNAEALRGEADQQISRAELLGEFVADSAVLSHEGQIVHFRCLELGTGVRFEHSELGLCQGVVVQPGFDFRVPLFASAGIDAEHLVAHLELRHRTGAFRSV